ncbi:MAG: FAD binding domain-containing protein [Rhodobacteraceae bacterium]|nr:FAD binding domain-containing protein [Paracoccaceae bacterium]
MAPTRTEDALRFLRSNSPKVVAGCTDYFPSLQQGQVDEDLLDVTRIPGMRGISRDETGWRIGAATTWTDIVRAPLPPAFDALKLAAREVGSLQIQNQGTVAGNICNASPAADGVPPLLALEATVEIAAADARRVVPLSEFITGVRRTVLQPDELVVALHVPDVSADTQSHFLKLGSRTNLVISIAMVAANVRLDAGRVALAHIAVGSCSPVARRLPDLEARLVGTAVEDLAGFDFANPEALTPLTPISDVRGSADYRLDAVAELCRRAVIAASARS